MASDVIAVMDALQIRKAAIVGWSDGAIIALDLVMSHPDRVTKIFAFAANFNLAGVIRGGDHAPAFAAYVGRTEGEYRDLSPQPAQYHALVQAMRKLWSSEPNFGKAQLSAIHVPTLIVDGDHDEIISRNHTEELARAIPSARLLIEPDAGHFAMLQDPVRFTQDMLEFLGTNADSDRPK
jgi:pimeloyl-ACP methyl ester carboxylesterase